MSIVEMKLAAFTELNKLNDKKDLMKVLKQLSKIALAKEKNPLDKTQHYEIAKRKHKEILKILSS
jgi:hypothetical protein